MSFVIFFCVTSFLSVWFVQKSGVKKKHRRISLRLSSIVDAAVAARERPPTKSSPATAWQGWGCTLSIIVAAATVREGRDHQQDCPQPMGGGKGKRVIHRCCSRRREGGRTEGPQPPTRS
jgi:hypothetical protein